MPTKDQSPQQQLDGFLAKYSPAIAKLAKQLLSKLRTRLPGAVELVYDNYNALAIAFGPSERTSDAIFSITLYPRWISLFFVHGAELPDPHKVLKGNGNAMRHIVVDKAAMLDDPIISGLMDQAVKHAPKQIDAAAPNRIVIKSVSAKQRPRRPA